VKKKIIFIIPSLGGGGAERVFVNLVKEIDKSIFEVVLVSITNKKNTYELPNNIKIINFNEKRVMRSPRKIIKLVWKEKPDLLVSTLGHMNQMILLLKPLFPQKTKVIIRQTNIISMNKHNNLMARSIRLINKRLLKGADKIICQSQFMKEDFIEHTGVSDCKVVKIYNPVDIEEVYRLSKENVQYDFANQKNIFFIGRLTPVKRVPLIISAFADYHKKNASSRLFILGDGPDKSKIQKIIKGKKLEKHVKLIGFQQNPYKWLKNADLFILASKHEGMPNVLIEALALEIPTLILKHPGGTKDIVDAVDIQERFVEQLEIRQEMFKPYKKNVFHKVKRYFGIKNIVKQYEEVFLKVIYNK